MSSENRPYLTSDDLAMLERVLAQSNFPRSVRVLQAEARSDAARVLIARFQRGVSSEARLRETLSEVSALDDYPDEAIGYDTAISITAADMPTILPGVQYGYGKRVEADKSWTIHHVFTGVPVSVGARDLISLDVPGRSLHLHVGEDELAARRAAWVPPPPPALRGYVKLYVDTVMQADKGADLDFLVGGSGAGVARDGH